MNEKHAGPGLWFMNEHVDIAISKRDNADGVSVLHFRLPFDDAPPLHVHREEDEIFHVLRGTVRFQVGASTLEAHTGVTVLAPRGVPHGFRVASRDGAEMLIVTRGGFEDLVSQLAQPASYRDLPQPEAMTPDRQAALAAACKANEIDILGPPISL
jgi:quercetin dioxygenase-like cupin family protein